MLVCFYVCKTNRQGLGKTNKNIIRNIAHKIGQQVNKDGGEHADLNTQGNKMQVKLIRPVGQSQWQKRTKAGSVKQDMTLLFLY